jgi:glutamine amidotransferase PdxT
MARILCDDCVGLPGLQGRLDERRSNLRSIRLKLRIVGVETMNTLRRCEKVVVPRQITAK